MSLFHAFKLALKPGIERWPVKTGTDAQAPLLPLAPQPTTIAALRAVPAPSLLPQSTRIPHMETTVFSLDCSLTAFKEEQDGDIHLVLQDDQGETMIAEIPDPNFVGDSSPFKQAITVARAAFDAAYTSSAAMQTVNVAVHLEGLGFFDRIHGQDGVAPSGVELHPVLAISFPSISPQKDA